MRTTLTIDDDVFRAVRAMAEAQRISIGKAFSNLAKKALSQRATVARHGDFPVFEVAADARPITLEDVRKGEDEP